MNIEYIVNIKIALEKHIAGDWLVEHFSKLHLLFLCKRDENHIIASSGCAYAKL